jgi:hypothetical protein
MQTGYTSHKKQVNPVLTAYFLEKEEVYGCRKVAIFDKNIYLS